MTNTTSFTKIFTTAIFVVVSIIFLYGYILFDVFKGDWAKSGVFGDSFGAINSLFSSLAFCGLVLSLIDQRRDMHEQRVFNDTQARQNLLSAKIAAAISKQEILAQL
jgi:hypothetical protein